MDQSLQPNQQAEGSYIAQADRGGVAQVITNIFRGGIDEARELRNRQNMLQLVWNTWIEGVLKQSLHNEVLIELGMESRPDAVAHPWEIVMQMPDREPEPLSPSTTILELFDKTNGSLLLLGEPGSGKTTMLLELCRLLIERAKEDFLQPIPVVFNLSSWKPGPRKELEQSFTDWLVNELRDRYSVPYKICHSWLENDALLLLLDGLDEVREENRITCVQAINAFRSEHSIFMMVSSRRLEYEALIPHLNFGGAVLIQPLTKKQVNEYLRAAGADLTSMYKAVKRDSQLQEFAQTPLILNVLVMAYRNATEEDLRALNMTEGYHKRLFNVYIDQMFKRRGSNHHYTPENTRAWLTWLAKRLVERRQTLFSIEDIQPGWLPISKSKRHLIFGLIFGLFLGPIFGLLYGLSDGLRVVLIMGLISGLTSGLIFGLIVGQNDSTKPTDKLTWSWKKARKWLIFGLVYGVIIGLGSGTGTLIGGLIVGLTIGLVVGMFGGLSKVTIEVRNTPAAGIRTSWKNYLLIWLIFALIVGLTIGMISWRLERLFVGLIFGIIGGLIFGLLYGGGFLIKHYISRWLLFRSGNLPWKLVDFLNYCTERIFLHKVGGGYIFIHRMLMEHFADMAQVREKSGIE